MSVIRDLTLKIEKYLFEDEILLIVGARQVGKTTVLHQIKDKLCAQEQNCFFLNLEDTEFLSLLNKSPKNIFKIFPFDLAKKYFLFIDEIQYLDNPSNFLKYIYDEYKSKIKIIASGSSAFYIDRKFKDSLSGRKRIFYLYSLSFREFLRFKNENELTQRDFTNVTISEKEKIILYYQEYLVYGGYPRVVLTLQSDKPEILRDIAYSYIKKDVYEANIRQNDIFYKVFKILAEQTGNLVNSLEIASTLGVSKTAIDNYLYVMQKSFHIALIRPFFKNTRKELTKMPKIYFMDLGLRNFFKSDFNLYTSRNDKGALLENGVFRQLLEKHYKEDIRFWRTLQKKEVDFIVDEKFAMEVKSQVKNVKIKEYVPFINNYPYIKFNFVSFDNEYNNVSNYSVKEVWEI